jgi:FkbM family methyltransferase
MFHWHDCPRAQDILEHKSFEPMSMKLWCELVRGAGTVFDVGAHVGVYALAAAALGSRDIQAWEPNPDAFARLALHIRMNSFGHITAHREAIGNKEIYAHITWKDKGLGWLSSGTQVHDRCNQEGWIETTAALKVLLPIPKNTVIKIDVEDAEGMVFEGMTGLENKPHIILECFNKENAAYITGITKPLGYEYFLIDEKKMRLRPWPTLRACDRNGKNFNQYLKPIS